MAEIGTTREVRWGLIDAIGLAVALVFLNASLTFSNIWPTLRVRWTGGLSFELALLVLALVFAQRRWGAVASRGLRWLAALWIALVVARYVDVTTRSLFGRSPSLYWDLQFIPDVGAMFAVVASAWRNAAVALLLISIPVVGYLVSRWALARVARAAADRHASLALTPAACAVCALWVVQITGTELPESVRLAEPAAPIYATQLAEIVMEASGAGLRDLPASPAMHSDFSRVRGADVVLIFMESYGETSWKRPELASGLVDSRTRLEKSIHETGRSVVSSLVESTTFGGESWLSHLSLLSGIEVRDERTTIRLMAQTRDTLVKAFSRAGYRSVLVMPGLLSPWPQGVFYGFDDIYDHERLDYKGPPFGWWDVNDQFALARVDALEMSQRDRAPRFLVFPTITTHAPFTPAPPYQPDWTRVVGDHPYDAADLDRAWSDQADWSNLSPSYVRAMAYAYDMVGGYLRHRDGDDLVLILIGDHQPPALVTGEGASWNVPMHVVTSRRPVLDRLLAHDFKEQLAPGSTVVSTMHRLLPILLDAFGDTGRLQATGAGLQATGE